MSMNEHEFYTRLEAIMPINKHMKRILITARQCDFRIHIFVIDLLKKVILLSVWTISILVI
jgi:hypothetical protein